MLQLDQVAFSPGSPGGYNYLACGSNRCLYNAGIQSIPTIQKESEETTVLWLILVLAIISIPLTGRYRRGAESSGGELVLVLVLGLTLVGALPLFISTQQDAVEIEAFWYTNWGIHTGVTELAGTAPIQNARVVEYNALLALYREWKRVGWLFWPALRYPSEECQPITLDSKRK